MGATDMATVQQIDELDTGSENSVNEVDRQIEEAGDIRELVESLTAHTLMAHPWEDMPTAANPFRGGIEAQFWPWNRAAHALLRKQDQAGALEVWSAMYLASLSMQRQFQHRYHKAMALCNIGFALGKIPGQRQSQ